MKTKKCCGCKEKLAISSFKSNKNRSDGLQSQCIECQKAYRRKHYEANRQKYIDKAAIQKKKFRAWWKKYKETFSCERCDESHPACLQFHHPNKDKDKAVSELVSTGDKKRVLEEVAKCIPLCANCHFKEHWKD